MALALAWALGLALAWAQGQKPKKPRKNQKKQKKQCFGTIGGAGLVGPKDWFFVFLGFFDGFLVLGDWGLAWLEEAPGASGRPWGRGGGRVERTGLA